MRWFARSLLAAIPVALGVVVCVFLLLRIVPGDPARMILGEQATTDSINALRDQLGLNLPVGQQLWSYVVVVFTRADIGTSLVTDQPVLGLILTRVPVTLLLVGLAVVFTVLIAVPLALVAATPTRTGHWTTWCGSSRPSAWPCRRSGLGLILILVFGAALRWLPVGGIGTSPADPLRSLILPALTVAIGMSPPLIRSLREQLLEVLDADFVVTLRAARLGSGTILVRHVLRNAAVPAVSLLGVNVAYLLGGTLVIEKVFAINGMGALLFNSISTRDFPVVQGITLVSALGVVVISLATDLVVAALDPRIRAA